MASDSKYLMNANKDVFHEWFRPWLTRHNWLYATIIYRQFAIKKQLGIYFPPLVKGAIMCHQQRLITMKSGF
uniref:Uncharacterized protein n=1 Tax=Arundo donax TaxID=35708 RepID=A0A0A9DPH2_ARUDO